MTSIESQKYLKRFMWFCTIMIGLSCWVCVNAVWFGKPAIAGFALLAAMVFLVLRLACLYDLKFGSQRK